MKMWKPAFGMIRIRLISPDMGHTITELTKKGVLLEKIQYIDELTIICMIKSRWLHVIKNFPFKYGERVIILEKQGNYWHIHNFLCRPILLAEAVVFLFLSYYVPAHIYFFQIVGNHQIPSNQIQETAFISGLEFGMLSRNIHSESLKNAIIGMIPQLRWVGITTKGSIATIHVKEGQMTDKKTDKTAGISSIVAACDGIIEKVTVLKGNPICKPGQAVRKGQMLISGLTDCGLSIRATDAEGEVYARTEHFLSCISPEPSLKRGALDHVESEFSLVIGKKIIKLWNHSGISTTKCVKMYKEYAMSLPGDFSLPVSLRCEKYYYYTPCTYDISRAPDWLPIYSAQYLQSHMIAGKIVSQYGVAAKIPGGYLYSGTYRCFEMIGRIKSEEIT